LTVFKVQLDGKSNPLGFGHATDDDPHWELGDPKLLDRSPAFVSVNQYVIGSHEQANLDGIL